MSIKKTLTMVRNWNWGIIVLCFFILYLIGSCSYTITLERKIKLTILNYRPSAEVVSFYNSPHKLRKMSVKDETVTTKEPSKGSFSGSFFLIMGSAKGEYEEGASREDNITQVRFSWETKDGVYTFTTLPIEKIKLNIVKGFDTPTVAFFLDNYKISTKLRKIAKNSRLVPLFPKEGDSNLGNLNLEERLVRVLENFHSPEEALSKYLSYAVITVEEGIWPQRINLPMNEGYSQ